MIIAQHALMHHLKQGNLPLYWIAGQDPYLCQQAIRTIKQTWQQITEKNSEEIVADMLLPQDWVNSLHDANTYALFATYCCFELRFNKKTLDAATKQAIQTYLDHPNPRSLVIIHAPELPIKLLQAWTQHPHIAIIQITAYSPPMFKKFIIQRLQTLSIHYDPDVPEIIYHYHQANLLACNQFLELLACMHDLNQTLSTSILMTYLRDQSEFSIYELGDACLRGTLQHALHILRQIQQAQTEPILIIWVLHQAIRQLAQLNHLLPQIPFQTACQQLKIWAQKMPAYQSAQQRLSPPHIMTLIKRCQSLDEQVKSNRNTMIWNAIEEMVMSMCQ